MFILTPGDSKIQNTDAGSKVGNFGGARQVTDGIQRDSDYTKRSLDARDIFQNPVEDTIKDVDDLNDSFARKSDTKRQEDLMTAGDETPLVYSEAGPSNKPLDEGREDNAVQQPDANKPHGSKHPYNPYFLDATGE